MICLRQTIPPSQKLHTERNSNKHDYHKPSKALRRKYIFTWCQKGENVSTRQALLGREFHRVRPQPKRHNPWRNSSNVSDRGPAEESGITNEGSMCVHLVNCSSKTSEGTSLPYTQLSITHPTTMGIFILLTTWPFAVKLRQVARIKFLDSNLVLLSTQFWVTCS